MSSAWLHNWRAAGFQNSRLFWFRSGSPARFHWRRNVAALRRFCCLICLATLWTNVNAGSFTNILGIDFEPSESYTQHTVLHFQGGGRWRSSETIYSSGVESLWPGLGWQAYVGSNGPTPGKDNVLERCPVTLPNPFDPVAQQTPYVSFSVLFRIEPSTQGSNDDFTWSFATSQQGFLFLVDFDNASKLIYYETNGSAFQTPSGVRFTNSVLYRLQVDMNFSNNLWSASLNGMNITAGTVPIASPGQGFNFGYFYAGWFLADVNAPGNNYMAFDHVRIVAGATPPTLPPPVIQMTRSKSTGVVTNTIVTEPGLYHYLDAGTNLQSWQPFASTYATNFSWIVKDSTAVTNRQRFFRARATAAGP